jgi:transcriptional regulator with XRE-family HTH domain
MARVNEEESQMSGLVDITSADELAAWMKRMNLSLSAAAEQLGRKRATIARYIKGETELPESVARHAAVIEAARSGQPFESRRRPATTH